MGYAVDKWLFFVTGGAAWTKVDNSQFATTGGTAANFSALDSTRRTGWTVGAGVDYAPAALKGNWIIRAEYLYVDFGSYTAFTAPLLIPNANYATNLSTRLDNHIVRFGLAYKFGNFAYAAR